MQTKTFKEFAGLSKRLLSASNTNIHTLDFIREVTRYLIDFSDASTVELWISDGKKVVHSLMNADQPHVFNYENIRLQHDSNPDIPNQLFPAFGKLAAAYQSEPGTREMSGSDNNFFIKNNSLFVFDHKKSSRFGFGYPAYVPHSLILMTSFVSGRFIYMLSLYGRDNNLYEDDEREFYIFLKEVLTATVNNHRNQKLATDRIKEMACLYGLSKAYNQNGRTFSEYLSAIAEMIPDGWQYPSIAKAKILLNGQIFASKGFAEGRNKQVAPITVRGRSRGYVEVHYSQSKPDMDEGPFLSEERSLIDAIASQVAFYLERQEADREKGMLIDQLQHSDKLAILGQLSAGVAHELNEPLSTILGFAQLIEKNAKRNSRNFNDIQKIIKSSLYARDIIRKLLTFAREMPPDFRDLDLNQVIEDGLSFFEMRCQKSGIEIIKVLSESLPLIYGDVSQISQVLFNLVVNSIHAMPRGGTLKIATEPLEDGVVMIVEDTGIGMSEDVKSKIFNPFFTTKDVNEGTGLGLSVVHGIIIAHKGTIKVDSWESKGTRFEIRFPIIQT